MENVYGENNINLITGRGNKLGLLVVLSELKQCEKSEFRKKIKYLVILIKNFTDIKPERSSILFWSSKRNTKTNRYQTT